MTAMTCVQRSKQAKRCQTWHSPMPCSTAACSNALSTQSGDKGRKAVAALLVPMHLRKPAAGNNHGSLMLTRTRTSCSTEVYSLCQIKIVKSLLQLSSKTKKVECYTGLNSFGVLPAWVFCTSLCPQQPQQIPTILGSPYVETWNLSCNWI